MTTLGGEYIPLIKRPVLSFFIQTFNIRQSAHQTFNILDPVTDGDIGQNIADISEFDLDIVLVP